MDLSFIISLLWVSHHHGQGLNLGRFLGSFFVGLDFRCVFEGFRSLGWEELFDGKSLELLSFGFQVRVADRIYR